MSKDETSIPFENEDKTILLYTGNIMMDGGRGGFLNTSKDNAEVSRSGVMTNDSVAGGFVETY